MDKSNFSWFLISPKYKLTLNNWIIIIGIVFDLFKSFVYSSFTISEAKLILHFSNDF